MKKKLIVALLAMLAFASIAAGGAQAATTWPASCHGWKCVNKHLNNLDDRVSAQGSRIRTLRNQTADLQAQVDALTNRLQSANQKLACITGQNIWREYGYDYNRGSYFYYLDFGANSPYGDVSGPFRFLVQSGSDSCQGTF